MKGQLARYITDYSTSPNTDPALQATIPQMLTLAGLLDLNKFEITGLIALFARQDAEWDETVESYVGKLILAAHEAKLVLAGELE